MPQEFTWERGPFTNFPACQRETFGILSSGGDVLTLRCTDCRYSHSEVLPSVDKRVIYLDQNIFSILFSVEAAGRLPPGHEDFSRELHRRLKRVVLLQQAILPHSDIHRDETIVFHSPNELRLAYERLGGDVSLTNTYGVERKQVREYAQAYIEQREPALRLDVDAVLEDPRNRWLSDMHISVAVNYTVFAEELRQTRENTHGAMQGLVERWARERPSFGAVLRHELNSSLQSGKGVFAQRSSA